MKEYIAPKIHDVSLRVEESIAVIQGCNGYCTEDVDWPEGGEIEYRAHGS